MIYLKCAQQKTHISTHNLKKMIYKKKLRFYYSLDFKDDGYDTANGEEWGRNGEVR